MPLPETHLRQIARWCEQKIPEKFRSRFRVEFKVRGSNVTLHECSVPIGVTPETKWFRAPMAQLRYDGSLWQLYWPHRLFSQHHGRWVAVDYDPRGSAPSPGPLLDMIADPRASFFGYKD